MLSHVGENLMEVQMNLFPSTSNSSNKSISPIKVNLIVVFLLYRTCPTKSCKSLSFKSSGTLYWHKIIPPFPSSTQRLTVFR